MDDVKHTIDAGGVVVTVAAFLHWMPDIAALLTAAWYVIRLVEWAKSKLKNGKGEA